ncbi:hypothetical protein [Flavobacterium silvaticum]|uniref:Uncharacterized protein n=1 Tax=Flavobacterium silvaticum TaxID=1852020 RepID=A0A972JF94_9FLAO|nr:hypothetical protein [Flavobacterium silvaticum]NMH27719.1 hypothetical protein [Flavobacterium silvaticum]
MSQIAPLYHNDLGISFFWCEKSEVISSKIQLVFKETGFYFNREELDEFVSLIDDACKRSASACQCCKMRAQCEKFLLKTPISQIDLAVTNYELKGIRDLVNGTIFKLELHRLVNDEGRN